jgi:hypothetical protein
MDTPHYVDEVIKEESKSSNVRESLGGNRNKNDYKSLTQNDNEMSANLLNNNQRERESNQIRPAQQQGFFNRWVVRPLGYMASFFCSRNNNDLNNENPLFADFPDKTNNINSFNTAARRKLGLLVIYQNNDFTYLDRFVNEVKQTGYIMDILRENYVIYPVLLNSNEGRRIVTLIGERLLYPSFIFVFNRNNSSNFNRGLILDRLEGEVSVDIFRDALIRNIENKERGTITSGNNRVDLIQQQKEELEYLERLEEEKKRKERDSKLKAQEEEEMKRKMEEEKEAKKKEKIKSLPPEPEAGNPDSTFIIFRYPDGDRRAERRFLKTDKIQVSYC